MPKEESPPLSDTSVSPDNKGTNKKSQVRIARTDSSASQASFPLKLQRILDKTNEEGRTDIISWLPHGKAFLVHDVDRFVTEVMSLHFNQTKYSSFQRQVCATSVLLLGVVELSYPLFYSCTCITFNGSRLEETKALTTTTSFKEGVRISA